MTLETASPPDRLSDDERKVERAKLEIWCPPQEFYDKVDALAAKVTHEELFNSPRLGFLLDAMSIAEFVVKLGGVKSVRLSAFSPLLPH